MRLRTKRKSGAQLENNYELINYSLYHTVPFVYRIKTRTRAKKRRLREKTQVLEASLRIWLIMSEKDLTVMTRTMQKRMKIQEKKTLLQPKMIRKDNI